MSGERWDADTYTADYKQVLGVIAHFFELFKEQMTPEPGDWVLELGVGSGKWSAAFAIIGCNVVCVDNNWDMLERVRLNFPTIHKSMYLVLDDAQTLTHIPDRTFDIIFTEGLYEHFLNKDERIEMLRVWSKKLKRHTPSMLVCMVPYKTGEEDEYQFEDIKEYASEFAEAGVFNNLAFMDLKNTDTGDIKFLAAFAAKLPPQE